MNYEGFKVREWSLEELKGRKIWIIYMCDAAFPFASTFRALGYDSDVLPRSKDPSFTLGRKHTEGDQCLPSISTTEDMLKRVRSKKFKKDKEAFFQGKSEGPCRFGRYYMNQLLILYEMGFPNVPVFTLDNRDSYTGLGSNGKILAWDGIIGQGMLERALHFTRPYEINHGQSEKLYWELLNGLCKVIEKGIQGNKMMRKAKIIADKHKQGLMKNLEEAVNEFSLIKVDKNEKKPVVFLTGEIYVRNSSVANQNLIDNVERLGGVVLLEPPTSFFDYVNEYKFMEYKDNLKLTNFDSLKRYLKSSLENKIMRRDEHHIRKLFQGILGDFAYDPYAPLVISLGSKYVKSSYKGEAIVTLGSSDYFAKKVDGIINTLPFNCMPGLIVSSMSEKLRKDNDGIPFLNLPYDGHQDPNREGQLGVFMYKVIERVKDKSQKNI